MLLLLSQLVCMWLKLLLWVLLVLLRKHTRVGLVVGKLLLREGPLHGWVHGVLLERADGRS